MKVRVHIERLILEGLPIADHDGPRVQAAVETGLVGLLASEGLPERLPAGGAVPRVQAAGVTLSAASRPDAIGRQIARSVYGGIGRVR